MTSEKDQNKKSIFSHPMLLLIAGALISSLLFPWITRQWQENEKEFELKTELVEEINKAVTDTLTAQEQNMNPIVPVSAAAEAASTLIGQNISQQFQSNDLLSQIGINRAQKYVNSLADWQISKEVIGSKLDLYYPSNDIIAKNWESISSAISGMWIITGGVIPPNLRFVTPQIKNTPSNYEIYKSQMCVRLDNILNIHTLYPNDPININPKNIAFYDCDRVFLPNQEEIRQFEKYSKVKVGDIDWNALFLSFWESREINQAYEDQKKFAENYFKLLKKIKEHKDDILAAISNSNIAIFG